MCKNLQADGEGTVQGTESTNAQRHKGPLDPPEKGRPGQVSEVSLISAGRILRASGGSGWPWGLGRACGPGGGVPPGPFSGKKEELWWGWGAGAFSEAEGPVMLRLRLSLPSNNLGAREILAALANRIILSV